MDINQTALNLYFGLLWELCILKDCIQFADQLIADSDTVPYEIIELSLSKTNREAVDAIQPLIQNTDTNEAIRYALGRMHYLGNHEPERLAKFASILYQYAITNDLDDIDGFNLFSMEYEYDVADAMGATTENADSEFMQALSAFKRENSHKPDWFVAA